MLYNQQQQGFNQNPGGVPYGGTPAHPQVYVGDVMQQYVPLITAKLYNDMVQRGTQYTQYMASLYTQNGYNNELLAEAIAIVADYAEYMMATSNSNFNSIIDGIVQDSNTAILEHHYRNNASKIPVPVLQAEAIRYQAIRSKMANLRPKINEFKRSREKSVSQYNQQMNNQPGNFPMPQQGGLYPQQQNMNQQQFNEHQQHLFDQQQYQQYQAMSHAQRQFQQPRVAVQQPGSSAFAQQVNQNMMAQQQPHQPWQSQQTWQPPQPQGFGNQAGMFNNIMTPQQQAQFMMQQQGFRNQPNVGQFATSTNSMQQMQQPPMAKLSNTSGYNPMPAFDHESLNPTQPTRQPQNPFDNHNKQFANHKQTQPQSQPSNISVYEQKVRQLANTLELPGNSASLSWLEDAINQVDPSNGLISKKNAYSEINRGAKPIQPTGAYDPKREVDLTAIKVNHTPGSASDNFATQMRDAEAAKSNKRLINQPDGTRVMVSEDEIQAFAQEFPNEDINTVDYKAYKRSKTAPYPFAKANLDGTWIVHISDFDKITNKGRFSRPMLYPKVSCDGYYVVDASGTIIDFFSRPRNEKENDVDYALHDDSKFFAPLTSRDVNIKADDTKMLETFAKLQVEQKVEEVIESIESQADVLKAGEMAMVVDKTIAFDDQVNGNLLGDDYYTIGYNKLRASMEGREYRAKNLAFRYAHVHLYQWHVEDSSLPLVKRLRYKDSYVDILSTLNTLSEQESFPDAWFTRINDAATRYVNRVIKNRYPLSESETFSIKSFCLDIESAIEEMDALGYGDDFNHTAKQLAQTLLFTWLDTSIIYQDYFNVGESDDKDDSNEISAASFGIVRDVTIIPLHSREIPLYVQKNECLLTEHGFKALWDIAKDRIENKNTNVAEVLIVTSDNRHMYISETVTDGIYLITDKSVFE